MQEATVTPVRVQSPVDRVADLDNEMPLEPLRDRENKESGKRGSARQRDFEMRASNIESINCRI